VSFQFIIEKLGLRDRMPRLYRPDKILSQGDEVLILTALILTAFGAVMVYSASYYIVDYRYFVKQIILAIVGFGAMGVGMFVDPLVWRRWIKVALLVLIVLMILQLVTPLGPRINGTRRWISLGLFNLQTSEVARCLLIILLARVLADEPVIGKTINKHLGYLLIVPIVIFILTMAQPDLSSMMMMFVVTCLMLFLGGMRVKYFGISALVAIPLIFTVLKPYQMKRILDYILHFIPGFQGAEWPYQQIQAFIAFVRGGFMGQGLAQGYATMRYLPEAHNDFIFAIIGEELGWFGASSVLVAVMLMLIRGIKICRKQPDQFGFLLSVGLISSLILYTFVNMGVNVGLLPITGLPLPFISAGGTSLVVSLWSVGVLWRLSRRIINE